MIRVVAFACLGLLASAPAFAVTLSIDADPTIAGVQDTRTVGLGQSVEVDLVLSDAASQEFDAYDVTVDFSSNLQATGFTNEVAALTIPLFGPTIDNGTGTARASFGAFSNFPSGDQVLATLTFDATALGNADLTLPTFLSGPSVTFQSVNLLDTTAGASIAVTPLPAALPAFATALLAATALRRRNRAG